MSTNDNIEVVNVEDAYRRLANIVLEFIASRNWDVCGVKAKVTPGSVTLFGHWLQWQGEIDEKALDWGSNEVLKSATSAIRFLRDNLLHTTGQRIWGLTFVLFPDGKFKIEYDYNKPNGYEETDEVITGDEINVSLANLNQVNKKS